MNLGFFLLSAQNIGFSIPLRQKPQGEDVQAAFRYRQPQRSMGAAFGDRQSLNCTPFVRQYDILSNKWGVLLCQKEYQTNDIRQNSKNW